MHKASIETSWKEHLQRAGESLGARVGRARHGNRRLGKSEIGAALHKYDGSADENDGSADENDSSAER